MMVLAVSINTTFITFRAQNHEQEKKQLQQTRHHEIVPVVE
jgi:hypothetical protein